MNSTTRLVCVLFGGLSLAVLAACNESEAESGGMLADSGGRAREVCTDEVVTRPKPVKDEERVLGTVAGALVGGVVGNEVGGKGTSGDIATVGGAIAGGYAGNRVQKSVQQNATVKTTERVCRTVYD